MRAVLIAVVTSLASLVRSRTALQVEVLALRHQLAIYQQAGRRPQLRPADRLLWAWLARVWSGWHAALVIVQPRTVISWQRKRFRDHWLTCQGKVGRPPVGTEVRHLIRKISRANPAWGAPRLVGELAKLGIAVAQSTVDKYRVRPARAPSPTWRTFLATHAKDLVSLDFFAGATVRFAVLLVLLLLAHDRRRGRHFNITAHPTTQWTAQQGVAACPWAAPRVLLRDRDGVYGAACRTRLAAMGIAEGLSAPRRPWQSPSVARRIGSIRREGLDHVVVRHERHLRCIRSEAFAHSHRWRCHHGLARDGPEPRPIPSPGQGAVVEVTEAGGLYRHYERLAA